MDTVRGYPFTARSAFHSVLSRYVWFRGPTGGTISEPQQPFRASIGKTVHIFALSPFPVNETVPVVPQQRHPDSAGRGDNAEFPSCALYYPVAVRPSFGGQYV